MLRIPEIRQPEYLGSYQDPVFGNRVIRITGKVGDPIPSIEGSWAEVARHGYSKRGVWNADMSLLYLERHQGNPGALFLDGETYKPLFERKVQYTESRWHPEDPERMIFVRENQLGSWKVRDGETDILETFDGYSDLYIGPWEGNLSLDGTRIALYAQKEGKGVVFGYDLTNKTKFADIDLGEIELDWVSISASGKYLVINGRIEGEYDQTQVLNLDGEIVGSTWTEFGRPSHYDLTLDADGEDIAVGVSKSKLDEGRVIKRRLKDGEVTVLTPGGWASHTSARNTMQKGWVYVTYQTRSENWPPFYDEVVAVKLDGSMTVRRLAHLHTRYVDYETEAHAVPSPDGSKVLWASNWEAVQGRPIATYVVELEK